MDLFEPFQRALSSIQQSHLAFAIERGALLPAQRLMRSMAGPGYAGCEQQFVSDDIKDIRT